MIGNQNQNLSNSSSNIGPIVNTGEQTQRQSRHAGNINSITRKPRLASKDNNKLMSSFH